MRRAVLLATWAACLVAVLVVAAGLGDELPAPTADPADWGAWLDGRPAADAAVALLRLVVVGLAAYLLAATAVALLVGPLLPTPAFVRSLVGAAAIGTFVVAPASASAPSRSPPELRLLDPPAVVPSPSPPPPAASTPATWVVQPGDHLWSIAERTAQGDVGRHWVRLVEANRDRLADPDLVLPGQEVVLPDYGPGP
jgi:nucleoid-associated protein YgaU